MSGNNTHITSDHFVNERQNSFVRNIIYLVLFLIVVSYFELFKFSFISITMRYLAQIVMIGIMLVLIIISIIYSPVRNVKMHFSTLILLLVISAIPSIFVAYYYHDQPVILSVWANRILLLYFLYTFVHFYKISVQFIIRLIIAIGLLAVFLFYLQYFLYPKIILDINIIEGRGTIRLFIAGMLCTQFAYFYFLNRFFSTKKIINLVLSLLTISIFILQGTRTTIFTLSFLTLVNLILTKQIKAKVWIFILFILAILTLFFAFKEIFNELTKVSSSQIRNISGGIRLKAAEFYLTKFIPNTPAYIFGNSPAAPGTKYSMELMLYSSKYGFYISDLGILGDYIKYGIAFAITGVLLLIKSIRFKISSKYNYLKYYIIMQCFTLITGYGILGGVDILIVLILYIFDIDRNKTRKGLYNIKYKS